MPIIFPRAMPDPPRIPNGSFMLERMQVRRMTRAGLAEVADIGPALWQTNLETVDLTDAQAGEWLGILESLRGGIQNIKIWPPNRRFPIEYPKGWGAMQKASGGAFTGQAVLDGIGVNNDTATISGLPDGFALQPGDFIAFYYDGGRRALHRIVESAVANASGEGTWSVEPFVRPGWSAAAVVDLEKPWCLMVVDPESISAPTRINWTKISFSALQTLDRS